MGWDQILEIAFFVATGAAIGHFAYRAYYLQCLLDEARRRLDTTRKCEDLLHEIGKLLTEVESNQHQMHELSKVPGHDGDER